MHHDRELASYGNDGPFLRVLSSAFSDRLAVPAKIRVLSEGTQDVLRRADEKASTEGVSFFGDPSLLMLFARIIAPWYEPKIRAGAPAPTDASRIFDGQHVSKRCELTHTGDLADDLRFRVLVHHRGDRSVQRFDLRCQSGYLIEDDTRGPAQLLRHQSTRTSHERVGRTLRNANSEALTHPANVVDQAAPRTRQHIACPQDRQVRLSFHRSMLNGEQQLLVRSTESCQKLR